MGVVKSEEHLIRVGQVPPWLNNFRRNRMNIEPLKEGVPIKPDAYIPNKYQQIEMTMDEKQAYLEMLEQEALRQMREE